MAAASQAPSSPRRKMFRLWNLPFSLPSNVRNNLWSVCSTIMDGFFYILGVFLICFATVIISGLTYTFFHVMMPMIQRAHPDSVIFPAIHLGFVAFLLINIISNYVLCIMTKHKGPTYDKVVRELAEATGFVYPETPEEVDQYKRDFEDKLRYRLERRQARREEKASASSAESKVTQRRNNTEASGNPSEGTSDKQQGDPQPREQPVRRWMIMGANEWGFCNSSYQPKPPRSHYDHVTRKLVLNMDHYCPWMFNTVGYFNYRYFCNFLLFVVVAMGYGVSLVWNSFMSIRGPEYLRQIKLSRLQNSSSTVHMFDYVPVPQEQNSIIFSFLLCVSVGLAVSVLLGFHIYLLFTAQTTIEFHGNCASRRLAKKRNKKYKNPYDLGFKRNFQQVYGIGNPILAVIIPSWREPEFLPLPLQGKEGVRPKFGGKKEQEGPLPTIV